MNFDFSNDYFFDNVFGGNVPVYLIVLSFLALLPGIVIMVKVYRMDKIEKEPAGLLLLLFICGIVSILPVVIAEMIVGGIINALFTGKLAIFVMAFIGVAIIEETGKFFALKIPTWKNRNFDYRFDAIVYSVTAALGFAIFENIMYVLEGGIITALLRAVMSVPAHAMFGLIMGVFYGHAKIYDRKGDKKKCRINQWLAILIPTIGHGAYDYFAMSGGNAGIAGLIIIVIAMYVFSWYTLKKESRTDMPMSYEETH